MQNSFKPGNRPVQRPVNHNQNTRQEDGNNVQPFPSSNGGPQRQSSNTAGNQNQPFNRTNSGPTNLNYATAKGKASNNPFVNRDQQRSSQQSNGEVRQIRCHGYKVHGGKAALEIKADMKIRGRDAGIVDENGEENVFHTVRIETALSNNSNDRTYNWQDKVAIQLTSDELPLFIAVFMGMYKQIEFSNHGVGGEKNSKYFSVEHQGNKVFLRMGSKGKKERQLPINLPQSTHIGLLALEAYCRNFNGIDSNTVLNSINNMCYMYQDSDQHTIQNRP